MSGRVNFLCEGSTFCLNFDVLPGYFTSLPSMDLSPSYLVSHPLFTQSGSTIYAGRRRSTGEWVAIKVPSCGSPQTQTEASVLASISHENIIHVIDVFDTSDGPAVVLPLAECDLFQCVQRKPLSEEAGRELARQMLSALAFLHGNGIAHRDVKPENILLVDGRYVLSDFGFAAMVGNGHCTEWLGSPHYSAPEIYRRRPYGEKVDIWSLGITLFVAMTGRMPYFSSVYRCIAREVICGLPQLKKSNAMKHLSAEAQDLLRRMLMVNPALRISAEEALRHDWLRSATASGDPKLMDTNTTPVTGLESGTA